ncbi:hypothetical protein ACEPTV_33280, partial [Burkholderia pseudomallei]|uniref:hypothetical protein n=1 Tax=Burkholderia pseudomallei TaxID=28450 RepID=UPI00358FFDEB
EPVPTVAELAARGLARLEPPRKKGGVSAYRISPEGEAILRDTMRRNAERMRAWDEQRRAARAKETT